MAALMRQGRAAFKGQSLAQLALAGIVFLSLAVAGHHLTEHSLLSHQQEAEAELHQEVALRLDVHAQLVHRLLDHVDTIHALTAEAFGAGVGSHAEVTAFLARQLRALGREEHNGIFQVAVIDRDGRLAWSTARLAESLELSYRDHFQVYAEGHRGPFISEALGGQASVRRAMRFKRPILDSEGGFRGATVVSVDPDLITRDLALVPMQEGGSVLLVRTDGLVLASNDKDDGWAGRQIGGANLHRILTSPPGVSLMQCSRTGQVRIAAWRQVPDWPAFVVHSLPLDIAAKEGRERAGNERPVIASALLALGCMTVAGIMCFNAASARQAARYAERARIETDQALRALPGAAYHLDIAVDGTVDWRMAAPAVNSLLAPGQDPPAADANPFDKILDAEAKAIRAEFVSRLLETREAIAEYNVAWSGAPLRRVREHARVFIGASGEGLQVAGQLTDVTAQRDLEARFLNASKMNTLSEMASGIAHEVNQPATAIALGADLALLELQKLDAPGVDDLRKRLEDVAQQAIRLRDVIAHFRAFTRPDQEQGPLTLQRLDLAVAGVRRIVEGMLNGIGVTLHVDLAADLPSVRCHLIPLEQALVNLIVNARDAVVGMPDAQRSIELSGTFDEGCNAVIVTVRDHGPGFPDHVLPHVFEPFFTTKGPDQGTGLGLSIVHVTMASFGGHVAVRNHPLGGAEVTLVFPQSSARAVGAPPAQQEETVDG